MYYWWLIRAELNLYEPVTKLVFRFFQLGKQECWFWQIFVEALEEFLIVIIQSRNSANTHKYSKNCHTSIAQIRICHVA